MPVGGWGSLGVVFHPPCCLPLPILGVGIGEWDWLGGWDGAGPAQGGGKLKGRKRNWE